MINSAFEFVKAGWNLAVSAAEFVAEITTDILEKLKVD